MARGFLGHGSTLTIAGNSILRVESFGPLSETGDEVEVTGFDSVGAVREYIAGLKTPGEVEFNVILATESMQNLQYIVDLHNAGTVVEFVWTTAGGAASFTFDGFVRDKTWDTPLDDKISGQFTVKIAGAITDKISPLYVIESNPQKNSTEVALNTEISVTFNENITVVSDFTGLSVSGAVDGPVALTAPAIVDNVLSFDNAALTENEDVYTVTIPAGTVKNADDVENLAISFQFVSVQSYT